LKKRTKKLLLFRALAAAPAWFVPPPPAPSSLSGNGTHVDSAQIGSVETIIVTAAPRAIQRDPHPEEMHDFNPRHSDAAAREQGNAGQGACKSSAYNTIGGQAATGADMIGMGGGHCN